MVENEDPAERGEVLSRKSSTSSRSWFQYAHALAMAAVVAFLFLDFSRDQMNWSVLMIPLGQRWICYKNRRWGRRHFGWSAGCRFSPQTKIRSFYVCMLVENTTHEMGEIYSLATCFSLLLRALSYQWILENCKQCSYWWYDARQQAQEFLQSKCFLPSKRNGREIEVMLSR